MEIAIARLIATVVLPSSGVALTIASEFHLRARSRCRTCVRSMRKLCANGPCSPGASR